MSDSYSYSTDNKFEESVNKYLRSFIIPERIQFEIDMHNKENWEIEAEDDYDNDFDTDSDSDLILILLLLLDINISSCTSCSEQRTKNWQK